MNRPRVSPLNNLLLGFFLVSAFILSLPLTAWAETVQVQKIISGKELTLADGRTVVLASVDCPDEKAKEYLTQFEGREITIEEAKAPASSEPSDRPQEYYAYFNISPEQSIGVPANAVTGFDSTTRSLKVALNKLLVLKGYCKEVPVPKVPGSNFR